MGNISFASAGRYSAEGLKSAISCCVSESALARPERMVGVTGWAERVFEAAVTLDGFSFYFTPNILNISLRVASVIAYSPDSILSISIK